MSDHDHPHHDDHVHEHDRPLSGPALRAKALESLLVEKRLVDPEALDELIDTRGVLKELGSEPAEDVGVGVWDSTGELRYLVLPERPAGTEGWSEDELAEIVTRDAMIGVAQVKVPQRSKR